MVDFNYNASTRQAIADGVLGIRVDRAESTIPHTAGAPGTTYFKIVGGKVLITALIGEITVEADGANACHIWHDPTTGTDSEIAAGLDVNACVIGDILTLGGLLTTTIVPAQAGSGYLMAYQGVVATPGNIGFQSAATTAGDWKWSIFYVPLDDGAYVEVA